jgi:hypothetical protein
MKGQDQVKESTVQHYETMVDIERVRKSREFQQSDGLQPMTKGWSRYRPHEERIIVKGGFGKSVSLTPTQHRVLISARTLAEGDRVSMRVIANSIGVAGSTVSRAMLILAAFGLVAYDVTRGRYGGITVLSTAWADLKARSKRAWAKLADQRKRAWERYLRRLDASFYWWSGLNVATITVKDATLT